MVLKNLKEKKRMLRITKIKGRRGKGDTKERVRGNSHKFFKVPYFFLFFSLTTSSMNIFLPSYSLSNFSKPCLLSLSSYFQIFPEDLFLFPPIISSPLSYFVYYVINFSKSHLPPSFPSLSLLFLRSFTLFHNFYTT